MMTIIDNTPVEELDKLDNSGRDNSHDEDDDEEHEQEEGDSDTDSVDEALMEMLGIKSFETKKDTPQDDRSNDLTEQKCHNDNQYSIPNISLEQVDQIVSVNALKDVYGKESICAFPSELSVRPQTMRRLTDELIYGSSKYAADRSYESIQFINTTSGEIGSRRVLTRLENFVTNHYGWKNLCYNHIARCISALMGEEMILYKEKLNLKPPGGSGFAPHLDTPSLRVASSLSLGQTGAQVEAEREIFNAGPQNFVTVMIAIDDMTTSNGCLKVCKGPWSEQNHCEVIVPEGGGGEDNTANPDAEGRKGAIPSHVAEDQVYEDIIIKGGQICAFNGWAPHRSVANTSPFPRRAVFLTYNPLREGDFHELYYQRMTKLRNDYKNRYRSNRNAANHEIDENELAALATIPRI